MITMAEKNKISHFYKRNTRSSFPLVLLSVYFCGSTFCFKIIQAVFAHCLYSKYCIGTVALFFVHLYVRKHQEKFTNPLLQYLYPSIFYHHICLKCVQYFYTQSFVITTHRSELFSHVVHSLFPSICSWQAASTLHKGRQV